MGRLFLCGNHEDKKNPFTWLQLLYYYYHEWRSLRMWKICSNIIYSKHISNATKYCDCSQVNNALAKLISNSSGPSRHPPPPPLSQLTSSGTEWLSSALIPHSGTELYNGWMDGWWWSVVQFAWVLLLKLASYLSSKTISGFPTVRRSFGPLLASLLCGSSWWVLRTRTSAGCNIEKWPHLNGRRLVSCSSSLCKLRATRSLSLILVLVLVLCLLRWWVQRSEYRPWWGGRWLRWWWSGLVGDEWSDIIVNRAQKKVHHCNTTSRGIIGRGRDVDHHY